MHDTDDAARQRTQERTAWGSDTSDDPCPERDASGYCNCKRVEHARRAPREI